MEQTEKKKRGPRRRFTAEFKAEAVRLVQQTGRTCTDVAPDLGIQATNLRNWVEQIRIDAGKGPPGALTSEERAELTRRLRANVSIQATGSCGLTTVSTDSGQDHPDNPEES